MSDDKTVPTTDDTAVHSDEVHPVAAPDVHTETPEAPEHHTEEDAEKPAPAAE